MSMKGLASADPEKIFKRSSHKRNDSGELDVFEAARYFSGYNEPAGDNNYTSYAHKYSNSGTEENRQRWRLGGGRISLDLPIRSSDPIHHHHRQDHHVPEKHEVITIKEKISNVKHKQPSSPGGRIANFLNSLFQQAGSKKNKSKSKSKSNSTAQARDEEESPGGWRRRRRSSISHFLSSSKSSNTTSTTTSSSKSLFSSSSSGFRTPPPYINTPTKNYKEFLNYTTSNHVEVDDHKKNKDLSWLDEKLKLIESLSERQRVWADDRRNPREEEEKFNRKINGENVVGDDDGAESDSSSDLFELQNYDLSCGGLPVYETTNVDSIKKSTAPVSTRPL